MKKRILLHSMTFKRDFGMIYILSKLLESLGCECIIANNTNLCRFFMKLWNPHAVFFVTHSRANSLKRNFPNSKLFHLSAEGGAFHVPAELFIIEDAKIANNIDRFYLWGKKTYDTIDEKMESLSTKEQEFIVDIREKCMVVGSPRMDISRFAQNTQQEKKKKINIGLVGNCYYLNNIKFNTLEAMTLHQFNGKGNGQRTIDEIRFQINLIEIFYKLINKLDPAEYSFSIRPYPLENFKAYDYFPKDTDIDTSLEFSSWLNSQDIVIGSTSTTITQIAISEKPYINLDLMLKRRDWEYGEIFAKSLKHHQPKDFAEILEMIDNYQDYKFCNDEMKKNMDYCYNASVKHSVLYEIGKDIRQQIEGGFESKFHLPKSIVEKCIKLWDFYIGKRSKEAIENDYSFFRYSSIDHNITTDLNKVVDAILSSLQR